MAIYAIGDVQGCARTLEHLLGRLPLEDGDRLWFAGDLVNRGPRSLEALRRVHALAGRADVVLGNHDLHLLAVAAGRRERRARDTLDDVLAAPDRDELLAWLAGRPLLVEDAGHLLVHAGLHPDWTLEEARAAARAVETALREEPGAVFDALAVRAPAHPCEAADARERLAAALAVLTRIRYVDPRGRLALDEKGPPERCPDHLTPWFAALGRRRIGRTVVFAHWAALGLHLQDDAIGLDTGCVWGGSLSAVRLHDREVWDEPTRDGEAAPG